MTQFELPLLTKFHLLRFSAILVLGLASQWVAWKFRIPSLLLLLLVGFLAGPVSHYLEPDVLFGELLTPVIAVSVGLILFQSSLELQFSELKRNSSALTRLIVLGSLFALIGGSFAAHYMLGVTPSIAALIGALSVISGPTVIIPLLRETPLKGSLGSIVRWEGGALEAIGSLFALLAFQVTYALAEADSLFLGAWWVAKTLLVGGGLGTVVALLVLSTIRSMQIPDSLKGGLCVSWLLAGFALSYIFVPESGLLTAIVSGLLLGNQRLVSLQRYVEFGEILRLPLGSAFFIILAARLSLEDLKEFSSSAALFVLALILLVRPLSVFLATVGSDISFREKLFVGLVAPRGAVAAAVASLFALNLIDIGFTDAERIVPVTFVLIIATVGFYGMGAPLIARLLDVAELVPRGVLILGAHDWAREIARVLGQTGLRVLVVDSNHYNVLAARREGLPARCENIFLDHTLDEVVLDGIKHFLALTSNNEVNTLASLHFAELFGPGEVYQLASKDRAPTELPSRSRRYQNQLLFSAESTFESLDEKFHAGWKVKILSAEDYLSAMQHENELSPQLVLLFIVMKNGQFLPSTVELKLSPPPGSTAIVLASASAKIPTDSSGTVIHFERKR